MILFEDLTGLVLWLLATIMTVNGLFLCFVFYRRLARKRYYAIKDSARERYQAVIAAFVAGESTVERATELLQGATAQPAQDAVEELLLETVAQGDRERMSELLLGTGHLERWVKKAFGRKRGPAVLRAAIRGQEPAADTRALTRLLTPVRRLRIFSVPRAIAVDHMGWLATSLVRTLTAEALRDPAFEVRSTAVSVIGRNRDPHAIPLLVEELARSVQQNNGLSLRSVKLALVDYDREDLPHFVPHLTHALPRVRFFLVDAVSQICNRLSHDQTSSKSGSSSRVSGSGLRRQSGSGRVPSSRGVRLNKNDFSREFYAVFIDRLVGDEFADVRARCAGVIRHFRDSQTMDALRVLLRDENEFVRLHAARACGDRSYAALRQDLARLLNDPKWRVREAAAQSLRALGKEGISELYRQFVTTQDRYASEQITDEIQRSGAIEDLAASLISSNEYLPLAEGVCRKMVKMGKTSLLLNAMASPAVPSEARAFIMSAMTAEPPPEFYEVLAVIAQTDTGPLGMKAGSLLETPSGSRRAASGGASA